MRGAWTVLHTLLTHHKSAARQWVALWLTAYYAQDLSSPQWDADDFLTAKAALYVLGSKRVKQLNLSSRSTYVPEALPDNYRDTKDYFARLAPIIATEYREQLLRENEFKSPAEGPFEAELVLEGPYNQETHLFSFHVQATSPHLVRVGGVYTFTWEDSTVLLALLSTQGGRGTGVLCLPEAAELGTLLLEMTPPKQTSFVADHLMHQTATVQQIGDSLKNVNGVIRGRMENVWGLANPWREIEAVLGLSGSPLASSILTPVPPSVLVQSAPSLPGVFADRYNASQQAAITAALTSEISITLIQGPPGTGKTTLIQGLLGLVLHGFGGGATGLTMTKTEPRTKHRRRSAPALYRPPPWIAGTGADDVRLDDPELCETHLEDEADRLHFVRLLSESDQLALRKRKRPRVLVCAPSNAAVDEIVLRLVNRGVLKEDGDEEVPNLVRMGPNASAAVEPHTLLARVNQRMNGGSEDPINEADASKRILSSCDVILTTLALSSFSALDDFPLEFDLVIIDEATQATETLVLISLMRGAPRLIMIGDPAQLPATVFSRTAVSRGLNRSLFARMVRTWPLQVLSEQYRMHPAISAFPRAEFYTLSAEATNHAGQTICTRETILTDAPAVLKRYEERKPMAWEMVPHFGHFVFYSLETSEEQSVTQSKSNLKEAHSVVTLLSLWFLICRSQGRAADEWAASVGVITPYKDQARLIVEMMERTELQKMSVEVNTVDAFQGREKGVIIFSAVRSQSSTSEADRGGIGFIADARRLNVALTRARDRLWIVGNGSYLSRMNQMWQRLVQHAEATSSLIILPASDEPAYLKSHLAEYLSEQPETSRRLAHEMPQLHEIITDIPFS